MELRLLWPVVSGPWGSAASLALTYLVHSTILVMVAALLARFVSLSAEARHACWKAALFVPLVSAALATLGSGHFRQWSVESRSLLGARPASESATAIPREAAEALRLGALSPRPVQALAGVGLAGMGLGLLHFAALSYRLRRRLRGRRLLQDPPVTARLDRLRARMQLGPVRLTESEQLSSPLVIGMREICAPHGLLTQLTRAEVDAVLAHELSHIERGDGIWFALAGVVQSALWLHPLNHLVCARFRSSAELACDERAVALTENPLVLARALVRVAERAGARAPSFAPTMVRRRTQLFGRVQRLLDAPAAAAGRRTGRRRAWPALLLFAAGLATLSVRIAAARTTSPVPPRALPAVSLPAPADTPSRSTELAAQSARMAALAQREQAIVRELSVLSAQSQASIAPAARSVRLLELSQELRHVRGSQAWLEEQLTFGAVSRSPR